MSNDIASTVRQLVAFDLAEEQYGVDVTSIHEIIAMQPITKVPRSPFFIEGIINLRGKVVPVLHMRRMFGFTEAEQTKDSRIIVVDTNGQSVGIIVDAVTEVLRIPVDSIESPSDMITTADSDYLVGIAKHEDRMIILLDLGKVLSEKALRTLSDITSTTRTKKEENTPEIAVSAEEGQSPSEENGKPPEMAMVGSNQEEESPPPEVVLSTGKAAITKKGKR